MAEQCKCKDKSNWHWTAWMSMEGVTKLISWRDKICNNCGGRIERETKEG